MRLSDVNTNETVMISHIEGSGAFRARLSEMGFVTGKTVKKLFTSPVGNPIVFELMGGQIALRKSEAEKIQVTVSGTADAPSTTPEADIPAPSRHFHRHSDSKASFRPASTKKRKRYAAISTPGMPQLRSFRTSHHHRHAGRSRSDYNSFGR